MMAVKKDQKQEKTTTDIMVGLVLTLVLFVLVLFISHSVPISIYDYSLEEAFYIGAIVGVYPGAVLVMVVYLWRDIYRRVKEMMEYEYEHKHEGEAEDGE